MINIELKNFEAAKQSITDLEYVSNDDANTFVLKIKVLILDNAPDTQLLEAVYQMQRADNFSFTHLLCVLQDLLEISAST